ncbi:hypothetical protein JKP88DRAFT_268821, partial [Tribonema minus]
MVRTHFSVKKCCAYASLYDELCMDAHHAEIYLKGPVNATDVLQYLLFSAMRRTALGDLNGSVILKYQQSQYYNLFMSVTGNAVNIAMAIAGPVVKRALQMLRVPRGAP